jgi:hypothetical protein
MPLDLGDNTTRPGPACRLIAEVRVRTPHLVGRPPYRPFEQMGDSALQYLIGA